MQWENSSMVSYKQIISYFVKKGLLFDFFHHWFYSWFPIKCLCSLCVFHFFGYYPTPVELIPIIIIA